MFHSKNDTDSGPSQNKNKIQSFTLETIMILSEDKT
jgi:hypothetical protein